MNLSSPWVVGATVIGGAVGLLLLADMGNRVLNELLLHLPGIDKVLHFVFSLALLLVFHWLLGRTRHSEVARVSVAVAGAALVGVVDEIQQRFIGGRSVELADVGAGLCGILVGVAWTQTVRRPGLAGVMAVVGLAAATVVTYQSHLETRDYYRGLLAQRQGGREAALEHYRAAVAAGVSNPEAYNALAWTILETGKGEPSEAVIHAERSLTLRPDNPDALDTYGWALYRAGRAAEAVRPLEQALARDPRIYCIHYHLGMAYLEIGRHAEARRHLRLQVQLMPKTSEAELSSRVLQQLATPREGDR